MNIKKLDINMNLINILINIIMMISQLKFAYKNHI